MSRWFILMLGAVLALLPGWVDAPVAELIAIGPEA